MTWAKFDDHYPLHKKLLKAGAEALALDVAGICHCNAERTNGFVSDDDLPVLFPPLKNPLVAARRLESVNRWERDDTNEGWWIHDFLTYNPSAEEVADRQAKRSASGKRGGQASAQAKRSASGQAEAQAPANPVSRIPLVDRSTSSSNLVWCRPTFDDDFSGACWLLAERKLESEWANGRGPKSNPEGWLRAVYADKRKQHEAKAGFVGEPAFLANLLEPAAQPKEHPLDGFQRAQLARMDRAEPDCPKCHNGWVETEAGEIECEACA